MKILHYVSFNATPEQRALLEELGVATRDCRKNALLDDPAKPAIKLDADEANPNWPIVQRLFNQWDIGPIIPYTVFTDRELDAARWLSMTAWENGYPLPSEDSKYEKVTYDLTACCPKCKLGKVQNAPFRIKCEPKWGRRAIMSLLWVHDEFFVPPAIWETIFKPFGIPCRPVAKRSGKELETVVQLVIDEKVDIVTEGLESERCVACGRSKYRWPSRGRFPSLMQEPKGALARTRQPFGTGWECIHVALISQELRRAMMAHKIRGADFTPVEAHLDAFEA